VPLLRRAGLGAIAPETLSAELKGMVNKKKLTLPLPAEWVERFVGWSQTGAPLAEHRQQGWDQRQKRSKEEEQ
jgi:hypothetical protein